MPLKHVTVIQSVHDKRENISQADERDKCGFEYANIED